jgi:hypothetical protein
MAASDENRRDRLERLKNKFRGISKIERLREFVRYDRARKGDLPHPFPHQYVDDVADALEEMLEEDYEEARTRERFIGYARKRPSRPFIEAKKT